MAQLAPAPERLAPAAAPERGLSIIVPCHNEERAIGPTLEQIDGVMKGAGVPYEIIVVDDASSDRTAELVDTARFRLIRHEFNLGYGASLKDGAAEARYNLIGITDADGTYPNERFPELLAQMGEADMIVGARIGENVNVPLLRRPAKWMITRLASYLTGVKIPDLNSGFRIARRELWEKFQFLFPDGFSLTTTITLSALTNRRKVKFVPIDYHKRVGSSKIRPIRHTVEFTQLIVRTVLYYNPMKVFVPASLGLIATAVAVGLGTLILDKVFHVGRFMDVTTSLLFTTGIQLLAIGALADLITRRMR